MGRKPIEFDKATARQIEGMAAVGLSLNDIAHIVGMNYKTMLKLYEEYWRNGKIKANMKVGERLYKMAVEDGNPACLMFWAKTQMGWRETQRLDHTSSDGSMTPQPAVNIDMGKFTPEQLAEMGMAFFRGNKDEGK